MQAAAQFSIRFYSAGDSAAFSAFSPFFFAFLAHNPADLIHNVRHHADNPVSRAIIRVDLQKLDIAVGDRKKRNRIDGDPCARAAAEKFFFALHLGGKSEPPEAKP